VVWGWAIRNGPAEYYGTTKENRGVVRLYQGISEIVADIWRPTVKDGLTVSIFATGQFQPTVG
jgi:hypothetical protein